MIVGILLGLCFAGALIFYVMRQRSSAPTDDMALVGQASSIHGQWGRRDLDRLAFLVDDKARAYRKHIDPMQVDGVSSRGRTKGHVQTILDGVEHVASSQPSRMAVVNLEIGGRLVNGWKRAQRGRLHDEPHC